MTRFRLYALAVTALLVYALPLTARAQNTCGALPFALVNGTTADATQVMADFNLLLNCINGTLNNTVSSEILLSANTGAPTWSAYTMPTSIVNKGILAGTATNQVGQLASCNNGVYGTGSGGVASCLTTFTTAQIASIFAPTSANTGATNAVSIANSGTITNAATQAEVFAMLSAAQSFVAMQANGGATASASIITGSGLPGGLSISPNTGGLTLSPLAGGLFASGLTTSAGGGADLALCIKAATGEIQKGPC